MEIHVTSQNYSALRLNQHTAGQPDTVQNQTEKNRADANKQLQKPESTTQTPEEVEKLLADAGFSEMSLLSADQTEGPLNSRFMNAVNAYTDTLNQPMQDQCDQLVAGIDLYV